MHMYGIRIRRTLREYVYMQGLSVKEAIACLMRYRDKLATAPGSQAVHRKRRLKEKAAQQ